MLKLQEDPKLLFQRKQPPSGGCVLKLSALALIQALTLQPPSGGCVLKHRGLLSVALLLEQPPSGGCVLKLQQADLIR